MSLGHNKRVAKENMGCSVAGQNSTWRCRGLIPEIGGVATTTIATGCIQT
jgi:hypothetical protein